MSHTKAPWVVQNDNQGLWVFSQKPGLSILISELGWGIEPADKANAVLISCAPEMLQMLERVRVEIGTDENFAEHKEIYTAIDALIKKARGDK